jgi:two-component system chemotaxis response regulator CheY
MKILLADDDRLVRTLVKVSLEPIEGVKITEARDGDEAWDLLRREPFDVVLLDWLMPGRSGLKLVRDARAAGLDTPIIMLTAEAKRERVIAAIQAGISDYLIKPFDAGALWSKLVKLCGQKVQV